MKATHGEHPPVAGGVFVRATGQADNIGDSLLRRALLRGLRPLGPLHVLVRALPADYVAGLGLSADDRQYTSERNWLKAAWRLGGEGRLVFALNAGEFQSNRFYERQYLSYYPLIRRAARSGGFSVQLGAGLRNPHEAPSRLLQVPLKRLSRVAWRDPDSREASGLGDVMPDWGFWEGQSDESLYAAHPRTTLTVSMRGDRPYPSDRWLDAVRHLAERESLTITTLSQVRSDNGRMLQLSEKLGASHVSMGDVGHLEHENAVRRTYARSSVVVSDRLHALVIAATEGAVPLGLVDGGSSKIDRHFRAIGLDHVVADPSVEAFDVEGRPAVGDERLDVITAVVRARRRITAVSEALPDLFPPNDRSRLIRARGRRP